MPAKKTATKARKTIRTLNKKALTSTRGGDTKTPPKPAPKPDPYLKITLTDTTISSY